MKRGNGPQAATSPLSETLRQSGGPLAVIAVFSFFLNLLYLTAPIYMLQVYDRVLPSGARETLGYLTLIAAGALIVLGILEAVRGAMLSRLGHWLERRLCGAVLAGSVDLTLAGRSPGAQLLRDLGQLRNYLRDGMRPVFDLPWMPVFVAVIWTLHPWLGVAALTSAMLLLVLAAVNEIWSRRPHAAANSAAMQAQRFAETAMRNAGAIRAMGMLPNLLCRWEGDNEHVLSGQQKVADRGAAIVGASRFVRLFVQVGILGLGALLVLDGELTAGGMVATSILLSRALAPIEQAIGAWRNLAAARSSHRRLRQLFASVPAPASSLQLPEPTGRLMLERVSFVPPGGRDPVLKQVSLELKPGQVLGIIGPSAAGKSTLCRLLVGVYPPTTGHVRLDGADVHSWDRADFGRHVGYLPQEIELFTGTVRENIARMRPTDGALAAADEAVVAAAMLADVHEMILRLPDGYETQVGENGASLSGGQRQRIVLARALFGMPRLLVLDEPAANLDLDGEAALMRAITAMKRQGRSVVLVAHRPSLLRHADAVLVLRDGAVVMSGSYDSVAGRIGQHAGQLQPAQ